MIFEMKEGKKETTIQSCSIIWSWECFFTNCL